MSELISLFLRLFLFCPEKPGPSPPRRDLRWAMPAPHCGGQDIWLCLGVLWLKSQIPNKFQISSTKLQINLKFQTGSKQKRQIGFTPVQQDKLGKLWSNRPGRAFANEILSADISSSPLPRVSERPAGVSIPYPLFFPPSWACRQFLRPGTLSRNNPVLS